MNVPNKEGSAKLNQLGDRRTLSGSISSAKNCSEGACCDKSDGVSVVEGEGVSKVETNKDERPSVWQLYYGMRAEGKKCYGKASPKDVPVFVSILNMFLAKF